MNSPEERHDDIPVSCLSCDGRGEFEERVCVECKGSGKENSTLQYINIETVLSKGFLEQLGRKMGWNRIWYVNEYFPTGREDPLDVSIPEQVPLHEWEAKGHELLDAYWTSGVTGCEALLLELLEKR